MGALRAAGWGAMVACHGAFGCGTTIVQYVQPPTVTVHAIVAVRAPEREAQVPDVPTVATVDDDDDDDARPAVRPTHVVRLGYGYQLEPRPAVQMVVPSPSCCGACGPCATVVNATDGWNAGAGGWAAIPDDEVSGSSASATRAAP